MTDYSAIEWPSYQLASGRWIKIGMERKLNTIGWGHITTLFTATPVAMEEHPWALGGLPEVGDVAGAAAGFFGTDSIEFRFHNIPLKPSVDDTTLYDILSAKDPTTYFWFMRIWISPGTTNTFATAPNWIFWIDSTEIDGDIHTQDRTWDSYTISARNPIALLEHVKISTWITNVLLHASYDYTPSAAAGVVDVDGENLKEIRFGNADNSGTRWYRMPYYGGTADTVLTPKFFRLTDVVYTCGVSLGLLKSINLSLGGSALPGDIDMSWAFAWQDVPTGTPVYSDLTFDDLYIVSSMYHSNGVIDVHDQKYGFFDPECISGISVFNFENVLEALKFFLVPFGLVAALKIDPSDGDLYLAVRELELSDVVASDEQEILEGVKLESGDSATFGFRVCTENGVEISDGDEDGDSIDQPFIGASRMRFGDRWRHTIGWTDDVHAFCAGLYVKDPGQPHIRTVSRITPKRDGVARTTISGAMPSPPHVIHLADAIAATEIAARIVEAGSVIARAIISYYWNGGADPATDPVGVYRRYTKSLTWQETGLKLTAQVGTYRTILALNWVVRSIKYNLGEDWTEFKGERGTYDA